MYVLVSQMSPTEDNKLLLIMFYVIAAGIFPIPEYLNKPVVNLLCHMLQIDPIKRASVGDVKYVIHLVL